MNSLIKIPLMFISLAVIAQTSGLALELNEIMYNPPGHDNNQEFVELRGDVNQSTINEIMIGDTVFNDSLILLRHCPVCNYTLIVEEGFDYSDLNCTILSVGATIGDNLNNDEDTVFLYQQGVLVEDHHYNDSIADGNGMSIEKDKNSVWSESRKFMGTPCEENSILSNENYEIPEPEGYDIELTPEIEDPVYLGMEYDKLFKLKNLDHVSGMHEEILVIVNYNISLERDMENSSLVQQGIFNKTINYYSSSNTGNFLPEEEGNYTLCGRILSSSEPDPNQENDFTCKNFTAIDSSKIQCNISLGLRAEGLLINDGQKISFWNELGDETYPYIIRYGIRDIWDDEVRNRTTRNTNKKSFTPRLKNKLNVFFIENQIEFLACNNSNNHTSNSVMVVVKGGEDSEHSMNSNLEILDVKKNPAKFGETIKVRLRITKGDTRKYSIKTYAHKSGKSVSDKITTHMRKKNSVVDVVLQLRLEDNCDDNLKDGEYEVTATGLGKEDTAQFRIEGYKKGVCKQANNSTGKKEKKEPGKQRQTCKIHSLYTRAKKYNPEIKYYARIDAEPNSELKLTNYRKVLKNIEISRIFNTSHTSTETLSEWLKVKNSYEPVFEESLELPEGADNKKIEFNVSTSYGENNITLLLIRNGSVMHKKWTITNFSYEAEPIRIHAKKEDVWETEQRITENTALKTYESKARKSTKYIKHLLVFSTITATIIFAREQWKKRRSKKHWRKDIYRFMRCSKLWVIPKSMLSKASRNISQRSRKIHKYS